MKKVKTNPNMYFDYRDVKTLQRFVDAYGRIEPMSKTGLTAKQQRQGALDLWGEVQRWGDWGGESWGMNKWGRK